MKNLFKKVMVGLLVAVMLVTMLPSNHAMAATIKLNKTKVSIGVGKTFQLKLKGTKKKVTWTSSNKKIATVSNKGKVKGIKKGSATIKAKVSGKTYSAKVTVSQRDTVSGGDASWYAPYLNGKAEDYMFHEISEPNGFYFMRNYDFLFFTMTSDPNIIHLMNFDYEAEEGIQLSPEGKFVDKSFNVADLSASYEALKIHAYKGDEQWGYKILDDSLIGENTYMLMRSQSDGSLVFVHVDFSKLRDIDIYDNIGFDATVSISAHVSDKSDSKADISVDFKASDEFIFFSPAGAQVAYVYLYLDGEVVDSAYPPKSPEGSCKFTVKRNGIYTVKATTVSGDTFSCEVTVSGITDGV